MTTKTLPAPTLKDVAKAAGLSVAAVSKVFNNREGVSSTNRTLVTRIAEEIGYRGRSGRSTIATRISSALVITLDKYVVNDVFYGQIIDSLLKSASEEGIDIDLALVTSNDPASSDYDPLRNVRADAVILVGLDEAPVIDAVRSTGRPAVLVNGMDRKMQLSSVSADYNFGGWAATQHLLELGHREIVHVTHLYRESLKRRMLGFRDAMEEAGIPFSMDHHVIDVGAPDLLTLSCRDKVAEILRVRRPRPTAIFCASDLVALGVIQAANSLGLSVPENLSIIGFDDLSLAAHASPPLTTMHMDREEMGRMAVTLLLEQSLATFNSTRRITLGVDLVERKTTGPITIVA